MHSLKQLNKSVFIDVLANKKCFEYYIKINKNIKLKNIKSDKKCKNSVRKQQINVFKNDDRFLTVYKPISSCNLIEDELHSFFVFICVLLF